VKPTRTELAALARRDPRLGAWMRQVPRFPGFPEPSERRSTLYETLAGMIVYQQLAGRAAETIHGRVCVLTPGSRFPSAREILALDDAALRSAGLSRPKIAAVRDLAARVEDGRLPLARIARRSDAEVVDALISVRGIGPWSAQMFLLFRLGRLDILAPGDLGLQEGLRLLEGLDERPTPRELAERGAVWSPLASVASWTLWRIVDHHRAQRDVS
jgi:3-methyladenine DNA glycosylase/8-oxoguanine DNA glycosylase